MLTTKIVSKSLHSLFLCERTGLRVLKYEFAAFITLGAIIKVASIVGMAIKAKKPSIRLIIMLKEVVALTKILAIYR